MTGSRGTSSFKGFVTLCLHISYIVMKHVNEIDKHRRRSNSKVSHLDERQSIGLFRDIGSPKLRMSDRAGIHGWLYYFAAFSPHFVRAVIRMLGLNDESLLLDPFLGCGTTCVVAKSMNVPSFGVELNPLGYFVSRAKLSWNINREHVVSALGDLKRAPNVGVKPSQEYRRWFLTGDPMLQRTLSIGDFVLKSFSDELRYFLMAALLLTFRRIVTSKARINPTWTPSRHKLPKLHNSLFLKMLSNQARKMIDELTLFVSTHDNRDCYSDVVYGDFLEFHHDRQFDAIITSPPYLTRLDYIMSFRLENCYLENLDAFPRIDLRDLRNRMIGTVTVTDKLEPNDQFGESCLEVMRRIKGHDSKAASSYYYPTIVKYFEGMFNCFSKFRSLLRHGGSAAVVVQTSYFKEIEIPVSTIFMEMAKNVGFTESSLIRRENVKFHRGLMDPEQRRYAPRKVLHEDVILLR